MTPSGTTRTVARRSTREIMEVIGTLNVQINRLVKLGRDRVPDFALELVDGSTVTSADLQGMGQPVFLYFLATW